MMNITKLADRVAVKIEKWSGYLRRNWKTVLVVLWMLIVTSTLIRQEEALSNSSSFNQVANLKLSLDDVRYSVEAMEADVETMQRDEQHAVDRQPHPHPGPLHATLN
jgi:hypothetical protein